MEKQMDLPNKQLAYHQLTLAGRHYPISIFTPLVKPRITHRQNTEERGSPPICLSAVSLKLKKLDPDIDRNRFFFGGENTWEPTAIDQLMIPPTVQLSGATLLQHVETKMGNKLKFQAIDSIRT